MLAGMRAMPEGELTTTRMHEAFDALRDRLPKPPTEVIDTPNAQFVRISMTGSGTLTLPEVEVMSGGCIPATTQGTCAGLEECVLHCESFGDAACLASCVEGVGIPEEHRTLVSELFGCVIGHCTGPLGPMTPACMQTALTGPCEEQHTACAAH